MRWISSLLILLVMAGCARAPEDRAVCHRIPHHRQGVTILIDPGHGGEDSGTQSLTKPPLLEKHYALTTALMLGKQLQRMGYRVVMSRRNDVFISLPDRTKLASAINADLFVSVHYNAAPNRKATGIEVFYYESKQACCPRREASKALASNVLGHVIGTTHMNNRGVKHGNFHVIRESSMPAILVEGGFMSNTEDLAKIQTPQYQNAVAIGIARGIDHYMLHHHQHR